LNPVSINFSLSTVRSARCWAAIIQTLRKRKGWTQTDMAVYLDMNREHISDIERGKREVGIITLQVIAKGLDTTMSNLLKSLR
jgi:transcriptional regulator with XRE-family HTH domain